RRAVLAGERVREQRRPLGRIRIELRPLGARSEAWIVAGKRLETADRRLPPAFREVGRRCEEKRRGADVLLVAESGAARVPRRRRDITLLPERERQPELQPAQLSLNVAPASVHAGLVERGRSLPLGFAEQRRRLRPRT